MQLGLACFNLQGKARTFAARLAKLEGAPRKSTVWLLQDSGSFSSSASHVVFRPRDPGPTGKWISIAVPRSLEAEVGRSLLTASRVMAVQVGRTLFANAYLPPVCDSAGWQERASALEEELEEAVSRMQGVLMQARAGCSPPATRLVLGGDFNCTLPAAIPGVTGSRTWGSAN